MTKPLDCKGDEGKSDFIIFDDKEHKLDQARLNKGETLIKTYIVTLKEKPNDC